jgi:putative transposase
VVKLSQNQKGKYYSSSMQLLDDYGQPQQKAYIERYNRTVRQEWLGRYIFETIQEVQDQATRWLWTYNNERPNMGIGGITPIQKLKMAA